jgi:hypothetical protein
MATVSKQPKKDRRLESPTRRQRRVMLFWWDFALRHGRWPTIREAMTGLGYNGQNGVMCHVFALQQKGMMRQEGVGLSHSWRLVGAILTLHLDEGEPGQKLYDTITLARSENESEQDGGPEAGSAGSPQGQETRKPSG